mgnify:CR=1 FL=1
MEIKAVLNNPKTGKTYQKVVEGSIFIGKQIGDKISGDDFGLPGYEFELKGGSDSAGFPMRKDIPGSGRKKALLTRGPGVRISREGMKKRKTVRGNTVADITAQVNLRISKFGPADLEELLGIKKEEVAPAAQTA